MVNKEEQRNHCKDASRKQNSPQNNGRSACGMVAQARVMIKSISFKIVLQLALVVAQLVLSFSKLQRLVVTFSNAESTVYVYVLSILFVG